MQERVSQSKIPLKQVYTPDDIPGFDYEKSLNGPGSFPYTRGRSENLYPGGVWIQRELSGEGEPARTNEQFKYLIANGALGLDVIGDAPTVGGLDPDHPFAANAIGTQGVSLCCLDDFRELYRDLPLDALTLSHSLSPQSVLPCLYIYAKEHGFDPAKLRGSVVQAPFYNEDCGYAVRMPFRARLRMSIDSIEFGTKEMPKFHSFVEDTYYISEAGLDSVEEMALGFVEIRYLVRQLLARGLDIVVHEIRGRDFCVLAVGAVRYHHQLFVELVRCFRFVCSRLFVDVLPRRPYRLHVRFFFHELRFAERAYCYSFDVLSGLARCQVIGAIRVGAIHSQSPLGRFSLEYHKSVHHYHPKMLVPPSPVVWSGFAQWRRRVYLNSSK